MSMLSAMVALLLTPEAPFEAPYLAAAQPAGGLRYQECVALIRKDAKLGREGAQRWVQEGGGAAAQHCQAIADLFAGFPRLAAARFEAVAERPDAGDATARATLYAKASLAWLDAEEPAEAERASAAALAAGPAMPELWIVAAKARSASSKWQAAVDAIKEAEDAGLMTPEAYVIRAKARRALGDDVLAAEDVAAALNIEPLNIDALTLRGDLAQAGVEIEAYYTPGADRP
jgi:tetratricopeptide (TPR) repeat protein